MLKEPIEAFQGKKKKANTEHALKRQAVLTVIFHTDKTLHILVHNLCWKQSCCHALDWNALRKNTRKTVLDYTRLFKAEDY